MKESLMSIEKNRLRKIPGYNYMKLLQALMQTVFHVGDRFWTRENRLPKKLKTSFF